MLYPKKLMNFINNFPALTLSDDIFFYYICMFFARLPLLYKLYQKCIRLNQLNT
jgi:hypothetical protein